MMQIKRTGMGLGVGVGVAKRSRGFKCTWFTLEARDWDVDPD